MDNFYNLWGNYLRLSGFTTGSILYDEMFSLQMTHQGLWEMIASLRINLVLRVLKFYCGLLPVYSVGTNLAFVCLL